MRYAAALLMFLFAGAQSEMTLPKVTHTKHSDTIITTVTTHTCPPGYEGHYVDPIVGFDEDYQLHEGITWGEGVQDIGTVSYTVCFLKSFMDEVRKNPDMSSHKPLPPRPD